MIVNGLNFKTSKSDPVLSAGSTEFYFKMDSTVLIVLINVCFSNGFCKYASAELSSAKYFNSEYADINTIGAAFVCGLDFNKMQIICPVIFGRCSSIIKQSAFVSSNSSMVESASKLVTLYPSDCKIFPNRYDKDISSSIITICF